MTEDFVHKVAMGIKSWLKEHTPHKIKTWQNGVHGWTVAIETMCELGKGVIGFDGKQNVEAAFMLQLDGDRIITINNIGNRGPIFTYEDPNLSERILEFINSPVAKRIEP